MNSFLIIMTSLGAVVLAVATYVMARDEWVYAQRIKLIEEDHEAFKRLPSYETMLYRRWWIWDIRKFLP